MIYIETRFILKQVHESETFVDVIGPNHECYYFSWYDVIIYSLSLDQLLDCICIHMHLSNCAKL